MAVYDPKFMSLLGRHDLMKFCHDPSVIYAVDAELRLAYFNEAWFRFARDNGGAAMLARFGLGASILDAIEGPLRDYYEKFYREVLASGSPATHDFECSSARIYRKYHQQLVPLDGHGVLAINALHVEHPHRSAMGAIKGDHVAREYLNSHGFMVQCSNCRCYFQATTRRWDWVPAWLDAPPAKAMQSLCEPCLEVYYPSLNRRQCSDEAPDVE